jgi:RNA polymerase sigma-70 factor (ECF subfamily)
MSGQLPSIDHETLIAQADFLRALARGLVRDEADAEDVAQASLVLAIERPPRERASLRPWLARVATRCAALLHRRRVARDRRERAAAQPERVPATDAIVVQRELLREVVGAVLALDAPYQEAILLRYYQGLPPRAIAAQLGIPVETAKVRLKRALALLRHRLDAGHDTRGTWALPLATLTGLSSVPPLAVSPWLWGVLSVSAKTKLVAAGLVLALGTLAWFGWRSSPPAEDTPVATMARDTAATSAGGTPPPAAATPERSDLAATGAPALRITGRVVDPAGHPVARAMVACCAADTEEPLLPSADPGAVASDGEGRFALFVSDATRAYQVYAQAEGFSPASATDVRAGSEITLTLRDARALTGTVRDLTQRPVAGARVQWRWLLGAVRVEREGTSGADGSYRIDDLPPPEAIVHPNTRQWILCEAEGYAPLAAYQGSPNYQLDLFLTRGAILIGRIVDAETRAGLAGARVVLESWEGAVSTRSASDPYLRNPYGPQSLGEVVSDAEGKFTFTKVPAWSLNPVGIPTVKAGVNHLGQVKATPTGYAPADGDVFVAKEGETAEIELACWPSARIKGLVRDPAGQPIAGATVWLAGDALPHSSTWASTSPDGEYELRAVPARRDGSTNWSVLARLGRDKSVENTVEVGVRAGAVTEAPELILDSAPTATILVLEEQGQPVPDVEVHELNAWSNQGRTGEDGTLAMTFQGKLRERVVEVRAAGFAFAVSEPFTPSSREPPEVEITLQPEHHVRGRVIDTEGEPVGQVEVLVGNGHLPIGEAFAEQARETVERPLLIHATGTTLADGSFDVGGLPAGTCHVMALHYVGFNRKDRAFLENVSSDASDLILTVAKAPPSAKPGTGNVDVVLTDGETGEPILNPEQMDLHGADESIQGFTCLSPGHFSWSGSLGNWVFFLVKDGYRSVRRDVALREDGETVKLVIALERGTAVHGRVRTKNDVPLTNGKVFFLPADGVVAVTCAIAAEGTYRGSGFEQGKSYRPRSPARSPARKPSGGSRSATTSSRLKRGT